MAKPAFYTYPLDESPSLIPGRVLYREADWHGGGRFLPEALPPEHPDRVRKGDRGVLGLEPSRALTYPGAPFVLDPPKR